MNDFPTLYRHWRALVDQQVTAGIGWVAAIQAVNKQYPALFAALVIPKAVEAEEPPAQPSAWQQLVNAKVAAGLSRVDAIRTAMREIAHT